MRKRSLLCVLVALLFVALSSQSDSVIERAGAAVIPAPADVLGFTPGDDRKLTSWAKVIEYFQKLDAASDRVRFEEIGKTTKGAPFVYATISAPENLAHLAEYKEIQRQLADPRILGSPTKLMMADRKAASLIKRGKTVVAITCGIHSTEVGSYLSSMLIAHRLAASDEPEIQEILRNTIILLVPSTNPDGVDIVNNWYQKTLGTPYEGTEPPELYHHYVGHDDNRDWYAFTQVETQLVVDKILNVWHPQIVHDIHQQSAFGSRLFLPPYMPPVEPNVPKQVVEGYTELGNYLAKEMRGAGFKGVTTDSTYDAWSPSRAYSHYHGGVRILSETASCRLATPITVKFEQLRPGEGYDPKKATPNFGPVWEGGEWHLRDITNHMTTAAFFLLKHAAQNREHWLERFYEIGKDAVRPSEPGKLFAFVVPYKKKKDSPENFVRRNTLLDILTRGGIEIQHVKSFRQNGVTYPEGTTIVRLDQPYGLFARALLERQSYPNHRDSAGRPIPPYDVTAHTLTLLMDVKATPIYRPIIFKPARLVGGDNYLSACGKSATYGLYRSFVPSMDEGWTRWIFEQRAKDDDCFRFESLTDREIKSGALNKYPTIIIPDQIRTSILNGHRAGAMPPEYTGGLGIGGVKALREFVESGGTLVFLNRASDFAIEQFKLPVRNVVDGLPRTDFYVPGSILRIELATDDPIAKGMPKESIAWVENSPVFEVLHTGSAGAPPASSAQREKQSMAGEAPALPVKVIAWYPKDRDPLLSGWLLGGERIKGKAALVEARLGKGRLILFGFRPQYRGQSLATYPLFFNAITTR